MSQAAQGGLKGQERGLRRTAMLARRSGPKPAASSATTRGGGARLRRHGPHHKSTGSGLPRSGTAPGRAAAENWAPLPPTTSCASHRTRRSPPRSPRARTAAAAAQAQCYPESNTRHLGDHCTVDPRLMRVAESRCGGGAAPAWPIGHSGSQRPPRHGAPEHAPTRRMHRCNTSAEVPAAPRRGEVPVARESAAACRLMASPPQRPSQRVDAP